MTLLKPHITDVEYASSSNIQKAQEAFADALLKSKARLFLPAFLRRMQSDDKPLELEHLIKLCRELRMDLPNADVELVFISLLRENNNLSQVPNV